MTKVIACIATVSFLVVMIKFIRAYKEEKRLMQILKRKDNPSLQEAIDTLNDDGNDYEIGYLIRLNNGEIIRHNGDGEWEIV